jgi:DNA transposition AAA+ family ATPase
VTRHYLGLQDASVLATRDLLLTGRAIADLIENEAMGAVVGSAGLGKTFAIEHALSTRDEQVITLTFEARPTMRLVADRLLVALTGAPGRGTRFAMTDQLLNRLSDRRRLVVIGEAQNLNRDCFEYLRHLHDDPSTRFALLFDGGDGCWEVLAREPMLRSRIYRRVAFRALSDSDVLALIPGYHPIYAGVDPELLVLINDKAANGRLRSWAAFTQTASLICRGLGAERIDKAIARNAISQLGTAR